MKRGGDAVATLALHTLENVPLSRVVAVHYAAFSGSPRSPVATALVFADPSTAPVRIAGLSQAARTVLTLRRAGLGRAVVRATGDPAAIQALLDAEAQGFPVDWADAPQANGDGALLILDTAYVRDLPDPARIASADGVVYYEDAGLVACPPSRVEALRPLLTGVVGVSEVYERVRSAGIPVERRKADFFTHPVADPAAAERALVRTLAKPSDGPIARNFDRRISGLISRALVRTPLTPNLITVLAALVGVGGAVLLGLGGYWTCLLGAALFVLSTILDGCDGEVARLKFRESKFGYHLDLVLDNVVYVCVFTGIAVGLARLHPQTHPLWACAAMIEGIVVNAWIMYFLVLKPGLTERIPMLRVFERIANGDFSYFVLAFALAGWLEGFLWGSAIGVHVFYITLLSCLAWLKSHPKEAAQAAAVAPPMLVLARSPAARLRVGGTPVAVRLLRAARIAGVRCAAVDGMEVPDDGYGPVGIDPSRIEAPVLVVDGALIVDPRILEALIAHGAPSRVATPGDGVRLALFDSAAWEVWRRDGRVDPESLPLFDLSSIGTYSFEQRAEVPAYIEEAVSQEQCDAMTERLLMATQKKVVDLPSEYIDPPFENAITRLLVNTSVTPNHVTIFCAAVAAGIAALFWHGWLWVGVPATYLVEWLDGVDGKLARLRLQFSELGKNEATVDYFCENAWWVCLGVHFASTGHEPLAWWAMGLLVVSDTLDNLWFTYAAMRGLPHPSELGDIDRRFHRIGGRRNIYCAMLLVGLLLQAPWEAYLAVAAWAFLTQLFHAVRIGQRLWGARA